MCNKEQGETANKKYSAPKHTWVLNSSFAYLYANGTDNIGSWEDDQSITDVVSNKEGSFFHLFWSLSSCYFWKYEEDEGNSI